MGRVQSVEVKRTIKVLFASRFDSGEPYFSAHTGHADEYCKEVTEDNPNTIKAPRWAICFIFIHEFRATVKWGSKKIVLSSGGHTCSPIYHLPGRKNIRLVTRKDVRTLARKREDQISRLPVHPYQINEYEMMLSDMVNKRVATALLQENDGSYYCLLKGKHVFLPAKA